MKRNQVHAPEPDLDAEKAKIWKSKVLIQYSISGTVCAFLGPYPTSKLNPQEVEETFPGYGSHKPRIFSHDSFNMTFMNQRVFRFSPSATHTPTYFEWIEKVEAQKAQFRKNLGIFNLIQLSKNEVRI